MKAFENIPLHVYLHECFAQVANAQIDALRLENKHLRQTIIQQTQQNLDHTETESHLRGIQESYQGTIKSLEVLLFSILSRSLKLI